MKKPNVRRSEASIRFQERGEGSAAQSFERLPHFEAIPKSQHFWRVNKVFKLEKGKIETVSK